MKYLKKVVFISFALLITSFLTVKAIHGESNRNEPIQPIPFVHGIDEGRAELGKMLFFDPRLSKSGFISCNSCHNLAMGGDDNMPSSIGHNWHIGPINSPTVLNVGFNLAQFWDGRAVDLKDQAGGPIEAPIEMAMPHEIALKVLQSMPEYAALFKQVYGVEEITMNEVTDALAGFQKTLITPNSRFDQWLRGDDSAISQNEKEGYNLFKVKGCIACHSGIGVGGTSFQRSDVLENRKLTGQDIATLGRYDVTRKEADKFKLKVPLLRNIEVTYPYFHDGSIWHLSEAVHEMAMYALSEEQINQIVAFLKTLAGEMPVIKHPILPPSTADTPRPNPLYIPEL